MNVKEFVLIFSEQHIPTIATYFENGNNLRQCLHVDLNPALLIKW